MIRSACRRCKNPLASSSRWFCDQHLTMQRAARQIRIKRKQARRLCETCSDAALLGQKLCQRCAQRKSARLAKKRGVRGYSRISRWHPNRTGLLLQSVYKDNPYLRQEWKQLRSYIADHIDLWHEPVEYQLTYTANIEKFKNIVEDEDTMKESKREQRNGRIGIRVPMSAWLEYQALREIGKQQGVDVPALLAGFVSRFLKKAEMELRDVEVGLRQDKTSTPLPQRRTRIQQQISS